MARPLPAALRVGPAGGRAGACSRLRRAGPAGGLAEALSPGPREVLPGVPGEREPPRGLRGRGGDGGPRTGDAALQETAGWGDRLDEIALIRIDLI